MSGGIPPLPQAPGGPALSLDAPGGSWGVGRGRAWLFAQRCRLRALWPDQEEVVEKLRSPSAPPQRAAAAAFSRIPQPALGIGHQDNLPRPKADREGEHSWSSRHLPHRRRSQSPQATGRVGHGHRLPGTREEQAEATGPPGTRSENAYPTRRHLQQALIHGKIWTCRRENREAKA